MSSEKMSDAPILPPNATMADYQKYVHGLEGYHGWLDVDLIHNCFLMGEEVGELFKAIRRHLKYYERPDSGDSVGDVAEEIVDVFNYLLALANRLEIDVEAAFRDKNTRNLARSWD